MTALSEYQRLECTGLWRDMPDAQKREVIVSFGDATLVISDAKNARALAHWSLPAVLRLNPGARPALFAPGPDAGEELEIDDDALIRAVFKVHTIIESRRPHPGRLRLILLSTTLAAVFALGLLWLPKALIEHTAGALPEGKQHDIGIAALADLTRLSGPPCAAPEGKSALGHLGKRLMPEGGSVLVLQAGVDYSAHLPGGIVLLGHRLIEDQPTANAAVGHVIAEQLRRKQRDPMIDLLNFAGLRATFVLLTTGNLPTDALTGYGEHLITTPRKSIPGDVLQAGFSERGVSMAGYLETADPAEDPGSGPSDPVSQTAITSEPIISDGEWVALQGICGS